MGRDLLFVCLLPFFLSLFLFPPLFYYFFSFYLISFFFSVMILILLGTNSACGRGWTGVKSHQLRLLHSFLVGRRVPRRVAGDVGARGPRRGLTRGGGGVPHRGHRGRAARESPAVGQGAALQGGPSLLHQLLEFGALVLEPDLHLRARAG